MNRRKKKTDIKENIGRVLLNFGQILFATLFLGGIIRGDFSPFLMIVIGGISAILFVTFGILLSTKEINKEE